MAEQGGASRAPSQADLKKMRGTRTGVGDGVFSRGATFDPDQQECTCAAEVCVTQKVFPLVTPNGSLMRDMCISSSSSSSPFCVLVGAVVLLLVAVLVYTDLAFVHPADAPRYHERFVRPLLCRWMLLRRACTGGSCRLFRALCEFVALPCAVFGGPALTLRCHPDG